MDAMGKQGESRTDAAALGGSVVAVAMTMFADPSPYDFLGCLVALTLASLILGYIGAHRRRLAQSFGLAAVFGIIAVPVWGFIAEKWQAGTWSGEASRTVAAVVDFAQGHGLQPTIDAFSAQSTVNDSSSLFAWGSTAASVYLADVVFQSCRKPEEDGSETVAA
jgi:hypothetical protein